MASIADSRFTLYLLRLYRSIWFLPMAYAVGSLLVVFAAPIFDVLVPFRLVGLFTGAALETILSIMASSMLAVAIFSLGTMVSSLEAAANAATPRARVLLTQDRTAQTAISTFIGAFIFSIFTIIALSTGYYSDESTVSIFLVTILLIAAVIMVLISWIRRLSKIGGVGEVIKLVEQAATPALEGAARQPYYGGQPLTEKAEDLAERKLTEIRPRRYGYLQHITGDALGKISEELEADIYLPVRPGYLMDPSRPLALIDAEIDEEREKEIRACFVIGDVRTFEEDPRFGLLVLSEIASRALSPGVNDPGTAIHVLDAQVRCLTRWRRAEEAANVKTLYPRFKVRPLAKEKLLQDAFRWIGRDAAASLEVGIKLQKALGATKRLGGGEDAKTLQALSNEALERARAALALESDIEILLGHRRNAGLEE